MKNKDKEKEEDNGSPFELATGSFLPDPERLHIYGHNVICVTDSKGFRTPNDKSMAEIVVDSSAGFIPLWAKDVTLNWRFSPELGNYFTNPEAAKTGIRKLLGEAILSWGDACPVRFSENNDIWDFEIRMAADICNISGCVLASAFFPQTGRDKLTIHPKMFAQPREEQIETLVHELGHVFGLRHFFAKIREAQWSSEIFGEHEPFSIMNYGPQSTLTPADISDLKRLYEMVWSGELTEINGTRIVTFHPYHAQQPGITFVTQVTTNHLPL